MQGGWSNADSDWQLKRLQHDSVKTVEKAVQSMRGVLQEDIIAHGQEYEKMFGKSSAQYNEYLNMVMEKLEQLGVAPKQVIEWLNQTAADGAVPVSQYGTDRDSQSETIPQIRAEPIPFDQQLQPQADFDSFARLEAAASQALAVGTSQLQTPASALPFSAFPSAQVPAPLPTPTSFPSAQMESQGQGHMAAQAPAPMAQPTFQSSLLSNSAAWGSPTPGQTPAKPTAVAEAWGLGNSAEPEAAVASQSSAWGQPTEAPKPIAATVNSSWGNSEPSTNSLKSALGLAASPVVQSVNAKTAAAQAAIPDDFNHETTWSAVPEAELTAVATEPLTPSPAMKVASSWDAEPEPVAPTTSQVPTWNAAPVASTPPQVPAWNAAPSAFVAPIAAAESPAPPTSTPSPGANPAFTQWGAPTSVLPPTKPSVQVESPWLSAASAPAPTISAPAQAASTLTASTNASNAAPSSPVGPSVAGWALPVSQTASAAPAAAAAALATPAPPIPVPIQVQAPVPITAPTPITAPAPITAPTPITAPAPVPALQPPGWPSNAPALTSTTNEAWSPTPVAADSDSPLPDSESPWTAAANSLVAETQWAAPSFPIPSPTLGPALTQAANTVGPMMAPISQRAPAQAPLSQQAPIPSPAPQPVTPMMPGPQPGSMQAPVFAVPVAANTPPSPWGSPISAPGPVPISGPTSVPTSAPRPVQAQAPLAATAATPPSPWGAVPAPAAGSPPAPMPVPMQAVAPVVSVAPVIPVATQIPANDQSATNQSTRPSFGGWPAGPMPNPYATQDAMQRPNTQQQLPQPQQQPQQQPTAQPASPPVSQGWPQQPMQNNPIATPQYQNAAYGNGGNGSNMYQNQRPEEREEPNYDPATAWD
ncbi:MAG: hypothetical protein WC028_18185 [Candidatus Obscuribacterales bacterium]